MKKCYISLSFCCEEVQRASIVLLVSNYAFTSTEKAFEDLSLILFNRFRTERKDIAFSEWLHSLSESEREEVRKNYSDNRCNFQDFDISEDKFRYWLINLSMCSLSGVDGIGEISGWEISTGFSDYLSNQDEYYFFEIDVSAEDKIIELVNEFHKKTFLSKIWSK